jgi:hypothetical protein
MCQTIFRKKELFGKLITFNETGKGNCNTLQGKSMEEILESYTSLYKYSSTGKQELPVESQRDGRSSVVFVLLIYIYRKYNS